MRVCPKCGFKDPPYWNPSRFREVEICRVEDFRELEPKLAENLLKVGDITTDKYHAYLLRPSQVVERVLIEMYDAGGKSAFSIPREKYRKGLPMGQRKLLEKETH